MFYKYRALAFAILLTLSCASFTATVCAESNWPSKPIKIVVPYPPGGAADTVARIFAEKLSDNLKQSVLVENKPGAGTAIAAEYVAKSAPDGYTLSLVPTGQLTILPHLLKDPKFDPFTSFSPISQLAYTSVVVAGSPDFPVKNIKQLVSLAKNNPGQLTYSSSGSSTIIHLAGEYFSSINNIKIQHIPYKGSAPAIAALLSNDVNIAFDTLTILAPQIKAGKVHGLVIAAKERSPLIPDVPTAKEAGLPEFEVTSWFGLVAPAGTPKEIIQRLNNEVNAIANLASAKETLATQGLEPWPSTPEQFTRQIKSDYLKYGQIIQKANIKFD